MRTTSRKIFPLRRLTLAAILCAPFLAAASPNGTDEVHIGGSPSYVELLTCAQMNQWSREGQRASGNGAAIPPVKP